MLSAGHGWIWDPWNQDGKSGYGPNRWDSERTNDPNLPEDLTNHLMTRHVKRYLEDAGAVVYTTRDFGAGMNEMANIDLWRGPNISTVTAIPNKLRWHMSPMYYFHANPYSENVPLNVYNSEYFTYTATGSYSIDWYKCRIARPYYANWYLKEKSGCDMYLSLHTNAITDTNTRGTLILHDSDTSLYTEKDYDGGNLSTHTANISKSLDLSFKLASKIKEIMQKYWDSNWKFGGGTNGVWSFSCANNYYYEVRRPQSVNALIEYAFHSNPTEEAWIINGGGTNEPWRRLMAQATYKAVCDYYGIGYELPSKVTDLAAVPGNYSGEVVLTWSAPGEDGTWYSAKGYIVKYSTFVITTQANFNYATTYYQSWTPQGRYTKETKTLTGLVAGVTYFFAIESYNDTADQSSLSNSTSSWAQITTSSSVVLGRINGKVTNTTTANKISNALCVLTPGNRQIYTDTNGDYSFIDLTAGVYTITVTASGYENKVTTYTITGGTTTVLNIGLSLITSYNPGSVIGKVKDSNTTTNITGAICFLNPGNQQMYTNATGDYGFINLTSGTYIITVNKSGYQNKITTCTITGGTTTVLDILLIPVPPNTGGIVGKIKDSVMTSGINGALCTLTPGSQQIYTDTNGDYSFLGLSTGTYSITASASGYQSNIATCTVIAGTTMMLDISLVTSTTVVKGTISGQVKDSYDSKVIIGAICTLNPGNQQVYTDNSGGYVFSNLDSNIYTIEINATGYDQPTGKNGIIAGGNNLTLDFSLVASGGELYGTITDQYSGLGISGVECKLIPGERLALSNITGEYYFHNITPGIYTLNLKHDGYNTVVPVEINVVSHSNQRKDIALEPKSTLTVFEQTKNVFTPSSDDSSQNRMKLSFNLSPAENGQTNGVLKLYDLKGRIVRTLELNDNSVTEVLNSVKVNVYWDGKTNNGEYVNSGVYFYQLELDSQIKNGKVIVAR